MFQLILVIIIAVVTFIAVGGTAGEKIGYFIYWINNVYWLISGFYILTWGYLMMYFLPIIFPIQRKIKKELIARYKSVMELGKIKGYFVLLISPLIGMVALYQLNLSYEIICSFDQNITEFNQINEDTWKLSIQFGIIAISVFILGLVIKIIDERPEFEDEGIELRKDLEPTNEEIDRAILKAAGDGLTFTEAEVLEILLKEDSEK